MTESLKHLVEALREELKQYGEMLALLDQQQEQVMHRQTANLLQTVADINNHTEVIRAARHEREQRQRHTARLLNMGESFCFAVMLPQLPAPYQPLVGALVQENNELIVRIQQRARQNHLLWYEKLLAVGTQIQIARVNENIEKLSRALPTAAKLLESAIA
jgi:hypothetical protein